MEAQSRAVNAASENARLAELAYENGAGTQVIDAQRQLQRVRFGLIQANAELRRDIAALFVATASDWRGAMNRRGRHRTFGCRRKAVTQDKYFVGAPKSRASSARVPG